MKDFRHFRLFAAPVEEENVLTVVTPYLLHRYLWQRVAARPRRLCPSSMHSVSATIIKLQEYQQIASLNAHPLPRGNAVSAFLWSYKAAYFEAEIQAGNQDPLARLIIDKELCLVQFEEKPRI